MDPKQIEEIFYKVIEKRGISEKLQGISKDVIYHWRKKSRSVTVGDMLNVLYQVGVLDIRLQNKAIAFMQEPLPKFEKNPVFEKSEGYYIIPDFINNWAEVSRKVKDQLLAQEKNKF